MRTYSPYRKQISKACEQLSFAQFVAEDGAPATALRALEEAKAEIEKVEAGLRKEIEFLKQQVEGLEF